MCSPVYSKMHVSICFFVLNFHKKCVKEYLGPQNYFTFGTDPVIRSTKKSLHYELEIAYLFPLFIFTLADKEPLSIFSNPSASTQSERPEVKLQIL